MCKSVIILPSTSQMHNTFYIQNCIVKLLLLLSLLCKYLWIWAVLGRVLVGRALSCIWDSLGGFCLYVLFISVLCGLWEQSHWKRLLKGLKVVHVTCIKQIDMNMLQKSWHPSFKIDKTFLSFLNLENVDIILLSNGILEFFFNLKQIHQFFTIDNLDSLPPQHLVEPFLLLLQRTAPNFTFLPQRATHASFYHCFIFRDNQKRKTVFFSSLLILQSISMTPLRIYM